MKKTKIIRILGMALILAVLFTTIPALPVFATDTMSLSVAQGKIGDSVTVIGSFTPSSTYRLANAYFSPDNISVLGQTSLMTTFKWVGYAEIPVTGEASAGNFTITFTVQSPLTGGTISQNVTSGTYYVYITVDTQDTPGTTIRAKASFIVTAPALDLPYPTSGPAGTDVMITGSNFPSGAAIAITHEGAAIPIKAGSETTVRTTGAIMTHILIPSTATVGTYAITVTAGTGTASTTFTVSAIAALEPLSPASGPAGTDVLITGTNFPSGAAIAITHEGTSIAIKAGSETTVRTSGIIMTHILIPSTAPAGSYSITVTAGTSTASTTFTVIANAVLEPLSPATGPAGTDVLITGSNFPSGATIAVAHEGTAIPIKAGSETTVRTSGIIWTHILIPSTAPAGSYAITVTAGIGTASTTFTVTVVAANPSLSPLSSTSGLPGDTVAISGSGFAASTAIVFTFDTIALTPAGGATQTDGNGSFANVVITIPTTAGSGPHIIAVTVGTGTVSADFTVEGATTTPPTTPPPTTPPPTSSLPISINQSGDTVGSAISIAGNGFTPGSTVTVTFNGTPVATGTADVNGFFVPAPFNVPAKSHGTHAIVATDGTHTGTVLFTIESTPPPSPQPLTPYMSEQVSSPVMFQWADVTDPSAPVTYDLQIATSSAFTADSIVIDKTKLEKSEYTLTEADAPRLSQEVPYYWRERAVDAALNESTWTGANEFSLAKPFEFTGWPLYLTIGVGALVLFLLGLWVGRRSAFYY